MLPFAGAQLTRHRRLLPWSLSRTCSPITSDPRIRSDPRRQARPPFRSSRALSCISKRAFPSFSILLKYQAKLTGVDRCMYNSTLKGDERCCGKVAIPLVSPANITVSRSSTKHRLGIASHGQLGSSPGIHAVNCFPPQAPGTRPAQSWIMTQDQPAQTA